MFRKLKDKKRKQNEKGDAAKKAQQKELDKRAEIDAQISAVEQEISAYEAQIAEKVAKIEETTAEIERLGNELFEQNKLYTERATSIIKKGSVSYSYR